jgi:hypothetical protein
MRAAPPLACADLVIDIGFEHGEGGTQPTKVWGTAIKFK